MFYRGLIFFSGCSHFFYGLIALYHPYFISEFVRYGFGGFRMFIGIVQSLLGVLLLIGFFHNKLKRFASLGLAIMMAGALGTRIHIGDTLVQSLPAIVYLIINLSIFRTTIITKK
jgi:uncharacterized membrane protein YphA (DoxX/SURF4 family)